MITIYLSNDKGSIEVFNNGSLVHWVSCGRTVGDFFNAIETATRWSVMWVGSDVQIQFTDEIMELVKLSIGRIKKLLKMPE